MAHGMEENKELPVTAESVVMRYRPPLMIAARDYLQKDEEQGKHTVETADVHFFEEFLKVVDKEGVKNYDFYSPPEYPGVQIPFTRVHVNKIYEHLTHTQASGSPKLPSEKFVFYQGLCTTSETGHPVDTWGEVYRQAGKDLQYIADAIANGKEIPDFELISVGSAHGFTGHATFEWYKAVREKGYQHYGEQLAQHIREKVIAELPKVKLTLFGYSGGTQTAYRTAEVLEQQKLPGLEMKVLIMNAVGFYEQKLLKQIIEVFKNPIGVFTEITWRSLMDPLAKEEFKGDAPFRKNLEKYLGQRYIPLTPDDKMRNLMIVLAEAKHLFAGTPYSSLLKGKVNEIRGGFDPLHFNLNSLKLLTTPVVIVPEDGAEPRKFLLRAAHYFDYNDLRVKRFLKQMRTVRTLSEKTSEQTNVLT